MAGVPFVLSGFEPLERLGSGGFGEVWLARQSNIDRRVAIKVGHAPIDDKTVQLRFERECIALGRLSGHPNILDVYTAGQLDDGRPYLVLEYINGGTLWQLLQSRAITERELIRLGAELSAALSVAHAAGILHRDLKPENILLRSSGEAVLGDFGIARLHDGAHTSSHAITASVAYAPPEILTGNNATFASDLYGMGVCMLAAVIRTVPFVTSTDQSIHPIINRVLTERPTDLRQFGVSGPLSELIQELLAKEPTQRPGSATEVGHRLQQLLSRPAAPAPPAAPALPTHSRAPRATNATRPLATAGAAPSRQPAPPTYAAAPAPPLPTGGPLRDADRIRIFGAAFGATILVGGLIVLALIRLLGSDGGSPSETTQAISSTDTSIASGTGSAEVVGSPSTVSPAEPVASGQAASAVSAMTGPLVLPLLAEDLPISSNGITQADVIGPTSSQFCDNIPNTEGLTTWVGGTTAELIGFPSVFQQLARFETAEQADAYVASYVGTIDCGQWRVPADEVNEVPELLISPSIGTPQTVYGDDTRSIRFQGESNGLIIYGEATLVRRLTDVYLLSVTSLAQDDIDELPGLLELAIPRLGY